MPTRRRILHGLGASLGALMLPSQAFPSPFSSGADVPEECDVLVVGSGAAGLAAALESSSRADVVLFEKSSEIGGRTKTSSGAINCVDPSDPEDSLERHVQDTLLAGESRCSESIVRMVVESSARTIEWLKVRGVEFNAERRLAYGGMRPRALVVKSGSGRGLISPLADSLARSSVKAFTNTEALGVVRSRSDGGISAVDYIDSNSRLRRIVVKKALIAASGGFADNARLCSYADPRLEQYACSGSCSADGSFMISLQNCGAAVVGMDYVGLGLRTKEHDASIGGPDLMRSFIFVNKNGRRFYPEDGLSDKLAEAVLQAPEQMLFALCDSNGFQSLLPDVRSSFETALARGSAVKADSIDQLGSLLGIAAETLGFTAIRFNEAISLGGDSLGRRILPGMNGISKPPFYAVKLEAAPETTLGGLMIDERCRVLDFRGQAVPGLYAAGEAAGGLHGTNRLGGNALLGAFAQGLQAAASAALDSSSSIYNKTA